MHTKKMTVFQLDKAVQEPIYLQSRLCYRKDGEQLHVVRLTDYLRAFTGVMGLEVFSLKHASLCFIAEVDMPPEVLDALARHTEAPA